MCVVKRSEHLRNTVYVESCVLTARCVLHLCFADGLIYVPCKTLQDCNINNGPSRPRSEGYLGTCIAKRPATSLSLAEVLCSICVRTNGTSLPCTPPALVDTLQTPEKRP